MTDPVPLSALVPSWELHLRAERKSEQTIKSYLTAIRLFLRWCDQHQRDPRLDKATVNAFIADLLAGGAEPATARARQLPLRRFSAWAAAEGELDTDELATIKPPKLDTKVVERLSDQQCTDLVAACAGKTFSDRRDEALVRLMIEAMLRAGEALAMRLDDVDLARGSVLIRRGKGGRGRLAPFGPTTGRALDRYLRARRAHPKSATTAFWLGAQGKAFGYAGLYDALARRAEAAGITGFHPHLLRHTGAQRWLSSGGSEGGLMTVAGWSHRAMLDRYTQATAAERAAQEARDLNLGEF